MARTYAQEGIAGLSQKNDFGLRLTFAVALPAILVVSVVATPLISAFFERGAFSHSDTFGVSQILFVTLLGDILVRMVGNIFDRGFYTLKNTITPPIISSIFVILFIATGRFSVTRWGYVGLLWAYVGSNGLGTLVEGILLMRKYPKGNRIRLATSILRYLLAALASFICGRLVVFALAASSVYIQLAVGGLFSGLVYILILYFIDRDMLISIFELFGIRFIFGEFQIWVNKLALKEP
jgi:putative peptidoglycan lipid II flippase